MPSSEKQQNQLKAKMFCTCPNCGTVIVTGKECKLCKKLKKKENKK